MLDDTFPPNYPPTPIFVEAAPPVKMVAWQRIVTDVFLRTTLRPFTNLNFAACAARGGYF
jgi:hypothetical protein